MTQRTGAFGRSTILAITRNVVAIAGLTLLPACASTGSVQNAPVHAGTSRTFEASLNRTVALAREAVIESGLTLEGASQMDKGTWMIMSKAKTSAWSWGEIVRVVVVSEDPQHTTVRVFSKRRISINITAKGDYSKQILGSIEFKLATRAATSS
jgi:hypothetical protein